MGDDIKGYIDSILFDQYEELDSSTAFFLPRVSSFEPQIQLWGLETIIQFFILE